MRLTGCQICLFHILRTRGENALAIVKMKKISVVALKEDGDRILDTLERLGVVEIDRCEEKGVTHEAVSEADVESRLRQTEKAASEIKKYIRGKPETGPEKNSVRLAEDILSALAHRQKLIDEANRIKLSVSALEPYKGLDVPIGMRKSAHVSFKTGFIPGDIDKGELQKLSPLAHFEIIAKERGRTYIWTAFMGNINDKLLSLGFMEEKAAVNILTSQWIGEQEKKIASLEEKLKMLDKKLVEYGKRISELSVIPLLREKERIDAENKIGKTAKTIVITGYVPATDADRVKKELTGAYVEISEPGDNAPVMFKNNAFAAPVEDITGTYSMPSADDIDPNPIMAVFYYLFFGMMFSDAGYGLLMIIVCGYMGFIKKNKMQKMMRMFFFCGISTTFWGLMYGSFFGNAVTSVAETFFGKSIALKPLWIDPTGEPLTLLIFSIALGFIQIIVGLSIKFYMLARRGRYFEAVFDTGGWIIALLGICITAVGIVAPAVQKVGIAVMIIGFVMLILTQGRDKKNIFAKLFGGIISLYDITSYISDILSYSRLMALGLATGVIAQVINILGSLGGKSVVGALMFAAVFIVGHAMNFAINMLGAYVHTNRLQYVEFYSKFYEGGGRKFIPFGAYYKG